MQVFSPTGLPHEVDSMASPLVNHSKAEKSREVSNRRAWWLELHNIAFVLNAKQGAVNARKALFSVTL